MGRKIGRFSALAVSRAKKPGYYGDGAGLYLQVAPGGTKSWIFRFTLAGQAREMGLGPFHAVSLAEARKRAQAAQAIRSVGIDPISKRRGRLDALRAESARRITFDEATELYIASHKVVGVKEAIAARQASLPYLPPYSPDLNPIEQVFAKLKALLRKTAERTVDALWKRGLLLPTMTERECRNSFRHARYAST